MLLIFGGGGIAKGIQQVFHDTSRVTLGKTDCDVRDPLRVAQAIDRYDPEMVVNCAGISVPDDPWLEVDTNLAGAITVALAARGIPTVLIGSVAGLYGKPGHVGYSASKAGVISIVQSLALEGEPIWCVSPGRVDTPMRERDYPNDTPGSRLTPEQVGEVVRDCLTGRYEPGTNVVIRKQGLEQVIVEEHRGDGWRERLRVGEPVTI